ncbi:MAG TPA: ornithine cyclodeaminase family protein, partial [Acetobacteraceae bacterium]|nr:ornithine cyclodeaminase family protein [Acetobacteraceae bacterium]
IQHVSVWNRSKRRGEALVVALRDVGFDADVASDLQTAVLAADIITCATLSATPLIRGGCLKPGAHLDLIGGFTPQMREADDEAIRRARVFIDTDAALSEAGDIVQSAARVEGDLFRLCRGEVEGRRSPGEITLFKSVGSALEDLAAAELVYADLMRSASKPMQSAYLSDGL